MPPTTQLSYRVHPGEGPYLALMHGFLSSRAQWQLNLDALSKVAQPVTIELWGHGDSPTPTEQESYLPTCYVDQLEQIRQALGCDRWFLCGCSLGAGLTIRYAHQHPERVYGHIFTNSQSGFADESTLASWAEQMPQTAAKIRARGHAAIERIAVHPRFAKHLPEQISTALIQDAAKLSPIAVANTLEITNLNVSARDIAATNPRPALMCFGKHEKRFHNAQAWAQANMANLTVVELNAGHGVNMEDAQGFNTHVSEFIRSLS